MRNDMAHQVPQLIYDLFYGSGGTWPTLAQLQRELDRRAYGNVDAALVVRHIPPAILRPLSSYDGYPAFTEELVITAEGIRRCEGSDKDITNFLKAVRWLGEQARYPDLTSGDRDRGMAFTVAQLAEAVSLSLDSDPGSVNRLLAILKAEGWVKEHGGARRRPWPRPLRGLANPRTWWYRGILGL